MTTILEDPLTDLQALNVKAAQAEVVTWQGHEALRLESGLALIPDQQLADVSIQVLIGAEGPAYPGIAARVADVLNYELAYAVSHVSGQWDALQYDPVFHGSNTWQIHHGPSYQRAAQVPTGRWFQFRADFYGNRAAFAVDGQPPLVVERLAHLARPGLCGLWTFRPAYFCDLRIATCAGEDIPPGEPPALPGGTVEAWFAEGYGVVACEPNGVLNLNRYLPAALGEMRLTRRFEIVESGTIRFDFGFRHLWRRAHLPGLCRPSVARIPRAGDGIRPTGAGTRYARAHRHLGSERGVRVGPGARGPLRRAALAAG